MPPVVSKVTSATFSFFLENHCDLRRPPVENVPSLVGLVGTIKVFTHRTKQRRRENQRAAELRAVQMIGIV